MPQPPTRAGPDKRAVRDVRWQDSCLLFSPSQSGLKMSMTRRKTGWFRSAAGAAILALAAPSAGEAAQTGVLHLRCSNAVGGASWSITVDLDRGVVDTRPARISDDWISWREPKAGVFELERATGKLQLRAASSTGGFFLHYICRPE